MASVAVLGAGVVGVATGHAFRHHGHEVTLVDIDAARVESLRSEGFCAATTLDLDGASTVVFVALPTPSVRQKGYDLSHLVAGLEALGKALSTASERHTVVVRSTVPPHTCDQVVVPILERFSGKLAGRDFLVASAPEFLREASALQDVLSPWMTVLASRHPDALAQLTELFVPFGGELRTFEDPTVAELIKVAHNAFNATKISFWNEMWRLCQTFEVDADDVARTVAFSAEGSTNPNYGIRGGFPYAGACLVKDIEGLLGVGSSVGLDLPLIASVQLVNQIIAECTWIEPIAEPQTDSVLDQVDGLSS
jgi:UDPglucose 6-dehydrogenase